MHRLTAPLVLLSLGIVLFTGQWLSHSRSHYRGRDPYRRGGPGGPPRPANLAQREAAARVITAQLTALRERDYARALSYQPASRLRSPDRFGRLVERDYSRYFKWTALEFGDARTDGTGKYMRCSVLVTGPGLSDPVNYALRHVGPRWLITDVNGSAPIDRDVTGGPAAD